MRGSLEEALEIYSNHFASNIGNHREPRLAKECILMYSFAYISYMALISISTTLCKDYQDNQVLWL